MLNNATTLAAVIHLIDKPSVRKAYRDLIQGSQIPSDHKEIVEWLHNMFPELAPYFKAPLCEQAVDLIHRNHKANISVIEISSTAYPRFLRLITDPPPIIFVRGNLKTLEIDRCVAMVGAREASPCGTEIAKRMAMHLGESGWLTVSGLALGIDTAAHTGALISRGKTIAVLAHGLDQASPRSNARLADQILEADGLWLSEHSISVPARREYFLRRNRLQIGLSCGSIIIEAALRSGSMAQANYCVTENRPLFAVVPQSEDNPHKLLHSGTSDMVLRHGALPIKSRDDYPNIVQTLTDSRDLLFEKSL